MPLRAEASPLPCGPGGVGLILGEKARRDGPRSVLRGPALGLESVFLTGHLRGVR